MSSVIYRDGKWYLKFRDEHGVTRRKVSHARTKTEARRLAEDKERRAERPRLGLEPMPSDSQTTLAELCRWWLDTHCPKPSLEKERWRLKKYIFDHSLAQLPATQVTAARISERLAEMAQANLAAGSTNRLRTTLHSVFARARKAGLWSGPNPVSDVEPSKVNRRVYDTLREEEIAAVLTHVNARWRGYFATAIYTGARKGELCGLLKSDVDLDHRVLVIARSYDGETTKGGRADVLPIAEPLMPYLREALEHSPGKWVFPGPDGKMRTEHADPEKVLQSALRKAGLVEGGAMSADAARPRARRSSRSTRTRRGGSAQSAACAYGPRPSPGRCERTTFGIPPQPSCFAPGWIPTVFSACFVTPTCAPR